MMLIKHKRSRAPFLKKYTDSGFFLVAGTGRAAVITPVSPPKSWDTDLGYPGSLTPFSKLQ